VEIELAYGKESRKLSVKDSASIVSMPPVWGLKDPGQSLVEALNRPIGSPPLKECLKGGRVVIVTSDKTRLVQYPLFLSNLLDYLNEADIEDGEITLVIGRGSHEGHTQEEIKALFGEEILARVETIEHDCLDKAGMIEIGKTRYDNPVLLNRRVVEAENVILTGSVKFHLYSGFSGGRKAVLPGVAAFETIQNNHKMALSSPGCGLGIFDGNPVHEEMLDAAQMLNPCFLINVVCNESNEIVRFFAGHWREAHEQGCRFVRRIFCPEVRGKADFVITSAGGYPDDINLYQSFKAVDNTAAVLRDGGVMLLLAECRDGFGPEEFLQWFDNEETAATRERLEQKFSIPGYIALCQKEMARRIRMVLVSSLAHDTVRKAAMIPAKTPEEGLREALKHLPPDSRTYVFPLGGTHVPLLKEEFP